MTNGEVVPRSSRFLCAAVSTVMPALVAGIHAVTFAQG